MNTHYFFRYVDNCESVTGEIEAPNITLAAIEILKNNGGQEQQRWKRHGIKERSLTKANEDLEYVVFNRMEKDSYYLEIKKVGSRKRSATRLYA